MFRVEVNTENRERNENHYIEQNTSTIHRTENTQNSFEAGTEPKRPGPDNRDKPQTSLVTDGWPIFDSQ